MRRWAKLGRRRASGFTVLAALALAAGAVAPARPASGSPPLQAALERAARPGAAASTLHLTGECFVGDEFVAFEVFGDGFGIWNERRQVRVSPAEIAALVRALAEADFASLAEVYGDPEAGRPRRPPARPPGSAAALELLCRIEVELDGARHRVTQLSEGERSSALFTLAQRMVEILRSPAAAGVTVAGLDDGLAKLAAGTLDPRTLRLTLLRKPELGAVGGEGFLLRLAGRQAMRRGSAADEALGEPASVELAAADFHDLVRALAALGLADLPSNLYADDYIDLHVELLGEKRSLQARRFAGLTATTHGERQRAFDRLLARLGELDRQVRAAASRE
jgi:hypothetical protein